MARFNITGMSCAACSARVEKAVSAIAEVDSCSVNLLTNSMTVEGSATAEAIIAAVEKRLLFRSRTFGEVIFSGSSRREYPR